MHGKSGLDGAEIKKREKLTGDAVEKIISIIRENPGKISIVAIGPETNVAKAFIRDPKLPSLIKQVVIMGGAVDVPGNKNRVAEFNIFVDPEAADIVFRAAVKKVLIPLDVCNDIILRKTDFEKLRKTPLTESVLRMMDKYIYGLSVNEKVRGALMYDPLAAYYLINPSAYELQPMDIKIETSGEITRGMTVVERRTWAQKNPNVLVATKIDGKAFKKDFLKILQ